MRWRSVTVSLCVASAVLVAAYIGLGSVAHWAAVLTVIFWVGLPVGGVTLVYALAKARADGLHALFPTFGLGALCVLAIVSCKVGELICAWELKRALSTPTRILNQLDEFHQNHRQYPKKLSEAVSSAQIPRLMDYWVTPAGFVLSVNDPRNLMAPRHYDLLSKQWKRITN